LSSRIPRTIGSAYFITGVPNREAPTCPSSASPR
jgi:hypothetical protein